MNFKHLLFINLALTPEVAQMLPTIEACVKKGEQLPEEIADLFTLTYMAEDQSTCRAVLNWA